MKYFILASTLSLMIATPALAKNYTIRQISDPDAVKPYYFDPSNLTIQSGDTVTFLNAQDEMHDVMFVEVPKGVNEMIMSPMSEKKGDKFSYTFTVPGTYKYHCHPHEKLGMQGTLIVGTPSRTGETVVMDHHKMIPAKNTPAHQTKGPKGTGLIKSINAKEQKIVITHDPIKDLGWPKMTMELTVDPAINLNNFESGQTIFFTLKTVGDEDYTIIDIQKK